MACPVDLAQVFRRGRTLETSFLHGQPAPSLRTFANSRSVHVAGIMRPTMLSPSSHATDAIRRLRRFWGSPFCIVFSSGADAALATRVWIMKSKSACCHWIFLLVALCGSIRTLKLVVTSYGAIASNTVISVGLPSSAIQTYLATSSGGVV